MLIGLANVDNFCNIKIAYYVLSQHTGQSFREKFYSKFVKKEISRMQHSCFTAVDK